MRTLVSLLPQMRGPMPRRSADLPKASWPVQGRAKTSEGPAPNPMLLSWHHSSSTRCLSVSTTQWAEGFGPISQTGRHTSQRGWAILGDSEGSTSGPVCEPGTLCRLQFPQPHKVGAGEVTGLLSLDLWEHREMKGIIYIIHLKVFCKPKCCSNAVFSSDWLLVSYKA